MTFGIGCDTIAQALGHRGLEEVDVQNLLGKLDRKELHFNPLNAKGINLLTICPSMGFIHCVSDNSGSSLLRIPHHLFLSSGVLIFLL